MSVSVDEHLRRLNESLSDEYWEWYDYSNTKATSPKAALAAVEAEIAALRAEVERLRGVIIQARLWRTAPCCLCGYKGPGYFQPQTHPCAALEGSN